MKLTINKGIFDENFDGTVENFEQILEATCPSQLTWTISGVEETEEEAEAEDEAEEETSEETVEETAEATEESAEEEETEETTEEETTEEETTEEEATEDETTTDETAEEEAEEETDEETSETDIEYECTFVLDFDNIENYKSKVSAIIGEDREIEVVKPEGVFVDGIEYEENFTSEELLSWLSNALVEGGFVSSENESYIFESDTTTFIFNSEEYPDTYEKISVSTLEYLDGVNIEIFTTAYGEDTYDRAVVFHVPFTSLEKKEEEITTFIEAGVPSDATFSWEDDDKNAVCTINMEGLTIDKLDAVMKTIFHSDEYSVTMSEFNDEPGMLDTTFAYKETIDTSQFLSDDYGETPIDYYISDNVNTSASIILETDGDEEEELSGLTVYESNDYEGYNEVFSTDIGQSSFKIEITSSYTPDLINVLTKVKGQDKIERDIEFVFSQELDEEEKNSIKSKIDNSAKEYAELTYETEDDNYIVTFKQEGTEEEVNEASENMFGYLSLDIHYARETKKTSLKVDSILQEEIYFRNLLGRDIYDIPLNYTLELTSGEKIDEDSFFNINDNYKISEEDVTIDGKTITITSDTAGVDVAVKATKFNFIAIMWWLLIVVFALAIITSIWMIISLITGKNKEKKNINNDTDTNTNTIDDESNIKETEELPADFAKKTCSNCGKEIDDEVIFCTGCGQRVEDSEEDSAEEAEETVVEDSTEEVVEDSTEEVEVESEPEVESETEETAAEETDENVNEFCTNCGKKLEKDDLFCTGCGTKV